MKGLVCKDVFAPGMAGRQQQTAGHLQPHTGCRQVRGAPGASRKRELFSSFEEEKGDRAPATKGGGNSLNPDAQILGLP